KSSTSTAKNRGRLLFRRRTTAVPVASDFGPRDALKATSPRDGVPACLANALRDAVAATATSMAEGRCDRRCGRRRKSSPSLFFAAQEKAVGRVVGLVPVRVAELCEVLGEARPVRRRHLDARKHAAVIGAVIAVVEQADVPAVAYRAQEREQRARPLG